MQVEEEVPTSEYDVRMDMLITEERIITRLDI
jgi:5-formyltetrahydrofolate cyclo-ligase